MTIVARAASGAISIIRLSGVRALELAKTLSGGGELSPRHAHLKKLYSKSGELLDEALIIYFKAPASFTGEDVVEFHTHGGEATSSAIIDELLALGARAANPGEFSKRAVLNGKMDLAKAESIAAMIEARSAGAAKMLARTLCGELGEFCSSLRKELIYILAHCEACIDYSDDDLPSDVLEGILERLHASIARLESIVSISEQRKGLIDGFKIAIIGKPNVGKSSILNALLAYDRAIVSSKAGTTRDTIEESVNFGGVLVRFVDTAGIRTSTDEIEKIGIEYSKKAANDADIIIAVFDASKDKSKEDDEIIKLLASYEKTKILVLNKCDLKLEFPTNSLPNEPIKISAKDDITGLKKEIKKLASFEQSGELMLTSNRQISLVKAALKELKEAVFKLNESELEIFAFHINAALKNIAAITEPAYNSDILDAMFGSFCLGK